MVSASKQIEVFSTGEASSAPGLVNPIIGDYRIMMEIERKVERYNVWLLTMDSLKMQTSVESRFQE